VDIESLRASLASVVGTQTAAELAALARPSVRLTSQRTDESGLPLGASTLGGLPDMPATPTWPTREGRPLAFVAQVRLEEVAPLDAAHLLPGRGLLSFFYDAERQPYGDDPADRGGWQVLSVTESTDALRRMPAPATLSVGARFAACALTPSAELTLPADQRATYVAVGIWRAIAL
jgi:uncharacterized protein YwqG